MFQVAPIQTGQNATLGDHVRAFAQYAVPGAFQIALKHWSQSSKRDAGFLPILSLLFNKIYMLRELNDVRSITEYESLLYALNTAENKEKSSLFWCKDNAAIVVVPQLVVNEYNRQQKQLWHQARANDRFIAKWCRWIFSGPQNYAQYIHESTANDLRSNTELFAQYNVKHLNNGTVTFIVSLTIKDDFELALTKATQQADTYAKQVKKQKATLQATRWSRYAGLAVNLVGMAYCAKNIF